MRNRDKQRVTAANRDALREMAFALHAEGLTYEQIAARLNISKNTVQKYVHQELPRRRYDTKAKEILDRVIASLESRHEVLQRRFLYLKGDGPQAVSARMKWSAAIERTEKQLLFLAGIKLPETDAEAILEERGRRMDQAFHELSEPVGYPELNEQAIVDRHIEEQDQEFIERYGYHPLEGRPKPAPTEEDDGDYFMAENWDEGY
jgi:transcriptional regulator with XRE-family HTH domain